MVFQWDLTIYINVFARRAHAYLLDMKKIALYLLHCFGKWFTRYYGMCYIVGVCHNLIE